MLAIIAYRKSDGSVGVAVSKALAGSLPPHAALENGEERARRQDGDGGVRAPAEPGVPSAVESRIETRLRRGRYGLSKVESKFKATLARACAMRLKASVRRQGLTDS
jgi:hypothetical protein